MTTTPNDNAPWPTDCGSAKSINLTDSSHVHRSPVHSPDIAVDFDTPPPSNLKTFVELSRWQAERCPERPAFTFLDYESDSEQQLHYGDLDSRIRAVAAVLAEHGHVGARVLIVQQPGLEYVASLFGCLYAGMVAVPVYPPDLFRLRQTLPRLQSITAEAGARIMLSSRAILGDSPSPIWKLCHAAAIATDEIEDTWADRWSPITPCPRSLALLQYTSGSTGSPRGVALSHANLVANAQQGYDAFDVPSAVACFWLPPYHDMGLIGGMLLPMYGGRHSVLMSPIAFIQSPIRWFEAITRFRGTTAASPNFGYEWCLRKIHEEALEGIDLSSWQVAISGAEPIRAATLTRFAAAYAGVGFSPRALTPAYGMAEATLAITGKPRGELPRVAEFDGEALRAVPPVAICRASRSLQAWQAIADRRQPVDVTIPDEFTIPDESCSAGQTVTLVGCGRPMCDCDLRIVDPVTRSPLQDGRVGEIWVRGPSVADHYWGQKELSEATFQVDSADGTLRGFLRTGDLGFIDQNELFVSGRLKEQIIIAGRNYFPHDLEAAIQDSHQAFRVDGGVAFSIDSDDGERLVIVHEVLRPKRYALPELAQSIRAVLMEHFGLAPDAIVLVTAATLPKTSSGKLQRLECRRQFLEDELQVRYRWSPTPRQREDANGHVWLSSTDDATRKRWSATKQEFAKLWCDVLGLEEAADDQAFLDVGGHSLAASQLLVRIRETLGVSLEFSDLLHHPRFSDLASAIEGRLANGRPQHTADSSADPHRSPPGFLVATSVNGVSSNRVNEHPLNEDDRDPTNEVDRLPLTPTQRDFWFLEQLGRRDAFGHVGVALQIEGGLDPDRLLQSLATLPSRVEALRLRFQAPADEQQTHSQPANSRSTHSQQAHSQQAHSQPTQAVQSDVSLTAERVDLTAVADGEREAEIERIAKSMMAMPFDLSDPPLARATLVQTASDRFQLLLVTHHLICDGLSIQLLMKELSDDYNDIATAPATAQADWTACVQNMVHAQDQPASANWIRHWEHRLRGANLDASRLTLEIRHADRESNPKLDEEGDGSSTTERELAKSLRVKWSADENRRWSQLANQLQVTSFAILLTLWHRVLARYTESEDLVLGIPVANRMRSDCERTIGCFINTLPFRCDFIPSHDGRGPATCAASIQHLQRVWWQDLQAASLPTEQILERSGCGRTAHRVPWIRHLVLQQPSTIEEVKFGTARVTDFVSDYSSLGAYDTSLICESHGDAMELSLVYAPSRLDGKIASNLLCSLVECMEAVLENPQRPIETLPIPGSEERQRIVSRSLAPSPHKDAPTVDSKALSPDSKALSTNGKRLSPNGKRLSPDGKALSRELEPPLLLERFAAQVRQRSDATAIEDASGTWSYAELDRDSSEIAAALVARGIGPGSIVGFRLPRSRTLPATLLGIWKAGAAYLPLDASAPANVLKEIIQDAAPDLLIEAQHTNDCQAFEVTSTVVLSPEQLRQASAVDSHPPLPTIPLLTTNRSTASSAAYVMYTSGSTGKPKGVVVEHGSLANLFYSFAETPGFDAGERFLAATTAAFDISVLELFLPLATGGITSLAPATITEDPDAVLDWITSHRPDVIQGTPSSLRMLLARGWEPSPHCRVWCGGESLRAQLANTITSSGATLWNVYGPTETTVWSLVQHVPPEVDDPISIGSPIASTTLAVFDHQGRPTPEGVAGELWIGGAGVARGYLRREDLTADRFVTSSPSLVRTLREEDATTFLPRSGPLGALQNRFLTRIPGSDHGSQRWYRSGDIVRWLSDGRLEFLGRSDRQIKLRGHRIELGEIEAAISQHPGIAEAAVSCWDATPEDRRIIGFYAPRGDEPVSTEELRAFLAQRLQRPMIPVRLIPLEAIPHNRAGKIDYRRLPIGPEAMHDDPRDLQASDHVPPRNPLEMEIAAIWQEFLGGSRIDVKDDFFRLGGHSLMAAQLLARLRSQLGVSMPIREIYHRPTIAAMASWVREQQDVVSATSHATEPHAPEPDTIEPDTIEPDTIEPDAPEPDTIEPRLDSLPDTLTDGLSDSGELVRTSSAMTIDSPLSFAEQRLWLVDQIEPNHPFYNLPLAAQVHGPLDVELLQGCLNDCVQRHETLRCTYSIVDGQPQRRVHDQLKLDVERVDLQGVQSNAGRQRELDARLRAAARSPFDLDHGPLLRLTVYSLAPEEHVVLLTMHHIISDGWSMWVMLGELAEFYRARRLGVQPALAPLAISYSQFAARQRAELTESRLQPLLEYWTEALREAPRVLDLPTDFPRPPVQDFEGAVFPLQFSPRQSEQIKQLAQQHRATPFMVLLSAYACLLSRYTGQRDLSIGTAVANRSETELEPLVGFFVNSLVLRMQLAENPSFIELLRQVRGTAIDAFEHQELPFERLVEQIATDRDRSHSPLFQTALIFQNAPRDFRVADGLSMTPLQVDNSTSKFDLSLFLWEQDGRIVGHVEYRTRLFREPTISRLVDSLHVLVDGALQRPETPIDQLPLLSESVQAAIQARGSGPIVPEQDQLLHELVIPRMRSDPGRPAISHADQRMTYGELDQQSRSIARGLQLLGVRAEQRVVVYMDRSAAQIASILAVLRCGGTFVPIETTFPLGRLEQVVKDADAAVVITDTQSLAEFGERMAGYQVRTPVDLTAGDDGRWSDPEIDPRKLAYLIYTSGSTGQPKGVAIEHRSISNFVRGFCEVVELTAEDRVLHQFSPSFDGWLAEVFITLYQGAYIEIVDRETVLDPPRLTRLLQDRGVTYATFTPPVLALLDPGGLPDLQTVLSAGAPLSAELADRWKHDRRLFNGYGPTECAVGVTIQRVAPVAMGEDFVDRTPAVGRPIANTHVYVLDPSRQFVPDGVVGEVYIGGAGVGRGYWGQPDLTEAHFLPDPWSSLDSGCGANLHAGSPVAGESIAGESMAGGVEPPRMYRTGDLGYWNAAGELMIVGRADDQVKLRGFRIEPAEIAAALDQLPEVRASVVVPWGDDLAGDGGERRLVAYIVPSDDPSFEGASPARITPTMISDAPTGQLQRDPHPLERQHIGRWQELFDQSQQTGNPAAAPEDDFSGWTSVITGRPIPVDQMRRWADQAAERILQLHPRRVLEIGCGTGLMLLRIGDSIEQYVGLDVLQSALDRLSRTLDRRPALADKVSLLRRAADELDELPVDSFDTIVLNSVVQYFPSGEYFLDVIRRASRLLSEGGRIFLGDLRDLRLHAAFATDVELMRSTAEAMTVAELMRRVQTRIEHDEELLLDPALFEILRPELPRLHSVRSQWKAPQDGDPWDDNELMRYRFDTTLCFDGPGPELDSRWNLGAAEFDPHSGIRREQLTWRLLQQADQGLAVSELLAERDRRLQAATANAADPPLTPRRGDRIESESGHSKSLHQCFNDPLRGSRSTHLIRRVREQLQQQLPQYMIPAAFVLLDQLPRTVQGKIDRKALPPPPSTRPDWAGKRHAARDRHEALLVTIWEELLGIDPIGIEDDFFELGGHSMLAVRMVAEVQRQTGVDLPLAVLFQRPTIHALAELLREPRSMTMATTVVTLNSRGSETPLFCIHPAGGTVFCYRQLAEQFTGERPVYGIQARGVDGRDQPHRTLVEMAADYVLAIRSALPEGPCHLLGWSLGGNIAYEVGRQLQAAGVEVGRLVMLDSGRMAASESGSQQDFLALVAALFPGEQHASLEELQQLEPEQQLEYFVCRASRAGIVPEESQLQSRYLLDVFRANVQAVHDHEPPPSTLPITLIRPRDQHRTGMLFDDPRLGWDELVPQIDLRWVPGDHAHMLQSPAVDAVAEHLQQLWGERF